MILLDITEDSRLYLVIEPTGDQNTLVTKMCSDGIGFFPDCSPVREKVFNFNYIKVAKRIERYLAIHKGR